MALGGMGGSNGSVDQVSNDGSEGKVMERRLVAFSGGQQKHLKLGR